MPLELLSAFGNLTGGRVGGPLLGVSSAIRKSTKLVQTRDGEFDQAAGSLRRLLYHRRHSVEYDKKSSQCSPFQTAQIQMKEDFDNRFPLPIAADNTAPPTCTGALEVPTPAQGELSGVRSRCVP